MRAAIARPGTNMTRTKNESDAKEDGKDEAEDSDEC